LEGLMCRSYLSVSWEGRIFDCDFNQQLDMGLGAGVSRLPLPLVSLIDVALSVCWAVCVWPCLSPARLCSLCAVVFV
jgi:hypothetical protein